jgi:hypothetical protein
MQTIDVAINNILLSLKARGWKVPKKATKSKPSIATSPDGQMQLYFYMDASSSVIHYSTLPEHGTKWLLGSGINPIKIEGSDVEKFASMADDFAHRYYAEARSSLR